MIQLLLNDIFAANTMTPAPPAPVVAVVEEVVETTTDFPEAFGDS